MVGSFMVDCGLIVNFVSAGVRLGLLECRFGARLWGFRIVLAHDVGALLEGVLAFIGGGVDSGEGSVDSGDVSNVGSSSVSSVSSSDGCGGDGGGGDGGGYPSIYDPLNGCFTPAPLLDRLNARQDGWRLCFG